MRRKLILFLCLLPGLLLAESGLNSGAPDRDKGNNEDSVMQAQGIDERSELPAGDNPQTDPDNKSTTEDWKKNGLFHALFHVGLNIAQIDGDAQAGYDKFGFDGGGGVLVRFHKYFSASMELNYTQYGAKDGLIYNYKNNTQYRVNLNYIQIPLSINVQDKDIIMFSAGINVGIRVGYLETSFGGVNITDTVQPQPKKYDVDAFAQLHVFIKKQYGLGIKFSYSVVPFRGVESMYASYTRDNGEYNNVITFRFMYILNAVKKR